jgi:hypothetical protein
MRSTRAKSMGRILLLVLPLAGLRATCIPNQPPAEAVLAGTWAVTVAAAPGLEQLLLTFDEEGQLSTVTYKVADNAVITVPSPTGTTSVSGQDVTITGTFLGNGLEFEGILNSTNTVITGTLTTHIVVGSAVVTIDNGAATLTKQ